jgi:hypothetical protein
LWWSTKSAPRLDIRLVSERAAETRAQRLGSHSELSMSVGRAEHGQPGRPRVPCTLSGAGR